MKIKLCAIFSAVLILFASIPIQSFAVDPITFNAMAAVADAFGMEYGIGTTYSVANTSGVQSSFQDLWDDFEEYQSSNGDSYSYQDYYDNFNDKDVVQSFTHSSGKFSGFHLDSEDVTVFTKFWNWLLSGPAQMVAVDNQYAWNVDSESGNVNPISIYNYVTYDFNGNEFAKLPVSWDNNGFWNITVSNNIQGFVAAYQVSGSWWLAFISDSQAIMTVYKNGTQVTYASTVKPTGWNLYRQYNIGLGSNEPVGIPVINFSGSNNPEFFTQLGIPKSFSLNDAVSNSNGIDINPYRNTDPIVLPDVSNPSNVESVDIVTTTPWDDSYTQQEDENGNPIPLPPADVSRIVDTMFGDIVDDNFDLFEGENPPPIAPDEVFTPLLPVNYPSFDFNLSGIWHYVRDWVSSLGSWFSMVFTIWSHLPYAIVVPVYASAVIVVVLGVYKRFFM